MSDSGRSLSGVKPEATGPPQAGDTTAAPAARAAVTAQDGSVIAAVSRHVRPAEPGEPGPEVVVRIEGDLDLDTAPLAQATVLQALAGAERVCLDLSGVRFFGAAGVRVVLAAQLHAAERGRAFRLAGVHGITARVLALTGVYPPA